MSIGPPCVIDDEPGNVLWVFTIQGIPPHEHPAVLGFLAPQFSPLALPMTLQQPSQVAKVLFEEPVPVPRGCEHTGILLPAPDWFELLHGLEEVIGALKALALAMRREELDTSREPLILLVVGVAHLTLAESIAVDLLINAHYVCSPYEARDVFRLGDRDEDNII